MPRRLVARNAGSFEIIEYELPPHGERDVRVRVEFGAPKHGTELHSLQGGVVGKKWDPDLRLFLPYEDEAMPPPPAYRGVGNMVVGTVVETGTAAKRFRAGERVFGYGALNEIVQASEEKWWPLGDLTPEDAVCMDPAHVAFVAVRDGNARIGDDVAVFGLGAIGLLTVQVAKAGGARRVIAIDPIASRREYAQAHGADIVFDPTVGDTAREIKRATEGKGVDVALETSGNARALQEAVRCLRQCGTVVHVAWGPTATGGLHFDEEWHMNRPTMIFSQAAPFWGNPDRDHPLWDADRAMNAVVDLLRAGKITGQGIVTPILRFEEAPNQLPALLTDATRAIKTGVTF